MIHPIRNNASLGFLMGLTSVSFKFILVTFPNQPNGQKKINKVFIENKKGEDNKISSFLPQSPNCFKNCIVYSKKNIPQRLKCKKVIITYQNETPFPYLLMSMGRRPSYFQQSGPDTKRPRIFLIFSPEVI